MKLLVKILLALLLTGLLCIPVLQKLSKDFLHDTISLHGSSISGNPVTLQNVNVDWRNQSLEISRLEISVPLSGKNTPSVLVNASTLQWDKTLQLLPANNTVLPDILSLDALALQEITIVYDADSEGGNLIPLRKSIADSANHHLRQRLNAANNSSTEMPQRFIIRKLQLKDIRIDARSSLDNTRQKTFTIGDLQYTDLGVTENGISMAEVINKVTEDISASIHQQALAQGVIDPPEIIAIPASPPPEKIQARSEKAKPVKKREETDAPAEDSKTKKAARNTGDALKKLSRKLFGDKG